MSFSSAVEYSLPSDLDCISRQPGAYALELALESEARLQVGRLGAACFTPGSYIYLGSARGPGGLHARLRRHILAAGSVFHWHIDYLRSVCQVRAWAYLPLEYAEVASAASAAIECLWSQALAALPGAQIPLPGFGAGDCRRGCAAHLIYLPSSAPGMILLDQLKVRLALQNSLHVLAELA